MKKLFCLFIVMCFGVLLCSANISLAKTTLGQLLSGKSSAKKEPAKQTANYPIEGKAYTFVGQGKRCRNPEMYCIDKHKNFPTDVYSSAFFISEIKNASQEFNKCIDNGNYKGFIEITAIVESCTTGEDACTQTIDKSSTCKRR